MWAGPVVTTRGTAGYRCSVRCSINWLWAEPVRTTSSMEAESFRKWGSTRRAKTRPLTRCRYSVMGISGLSCWLWKPPDPRGWAAVPASFLSHDPASGSCPPPFSWNAAACLLHVWSAPWASDPWLRQLWNGGSFSSTSCLPFENSCGWRPGRLLTPTGQRTELSDRSKVAFCATWAEAGSVGSDSVEATSDSVLERRDFCGWASPAGANWELKGQEERTHLHETFRSCGWTHTHTNLTGGLC